MKKYNISLFLIVFIPSLHALNTGFPYLIHVAFLSLALIIFRQDKLNKNIYETELIFLVIVLLITFLSIIRQSLQFENLIFSDFSFIAKIIVLLLVFFLSSCVAVDNSSDQNRIIVKVVFVMLLLLVMQSFFVFFQTLYANKNLIAQGRYSSVGISHFEACSISIIFSLTYLSNKLFLRKRLSSIESFMLMMSPLIFAFFSSSKGALIVSLIWGIIVLSKINKQFYFMKYVFLLTTVVSVMYLYKDEASYIYLGLIDLIHLSEGENLSIVTRLEDLANLSILLEKNNLFFLGAGLNRSSFFHYFEIGIVSQIANIGFIGTFFYYCLIYRLFMNFFTKENTMICLFVFLTFLIGDCVGNFTDGLKTLAVLGYLSMCQKRKKSIFLTPNNYSIPKL